MPHDSVSTTRAVGTDRLFVMIDKAEEVVRICIREYAGPVYTDTYPGGIRITFIIGTTQPIGIEIPAAKVQVEAI